jgi:hypothetical protein
MNQVLISTIVNYKFFFLLAETELDDPKSLKDALLNKCLLSRKSSKEKFGSIPDRQATNKLNEVIYV